jgi:hypothetical protein
MARLHKEKQAAVTTGSAQTTGLPCADGFNGCFVLSSGTGLIAPVIGAMRSIVANVAPASGRQDHTT